MSYTEAVRKAKAAHKRTGGTFFVVWDIDHESGFGHTHHVASEEDMDTFFLGVSDRNILWCTDED